MRVRRLPSPLDSIFFPFVAVCGLKVHHLAVRDLTLWFAPHVYAHRLVCGFNRLAGLESIH